MEIIGWIGHLSELEVDISSSQVIIRAMIIINLRIYILKESLYVTSRMLWTSSIKSMRQ